MLRPNNPRRGLPIVMKRTPRAMDRDAARQAVREVNREAFGHQHGWLHEIEDQTVTDRRVAAEIARWQKEKADA